MLKKNCSWIKPVSQRKFSCVTPKVECDVIGYNDVIREQIYGPSKTICPWTSQTSLQIGNYPKAKNLYSFL